MMLFLFLFKPGDKLVCVLTAVQVRGVGGARHLQECNDDVC